jgi:hypothetical protein
MGYKLFLLIMMLALDGGSPARAEFADLFGGLTKPKASVKDVQDLTCQYANATLKAKNETSCRACGKKIKEWKEKFNSVADTASSTDKSLESQTKSSVGSTASNLGSSAKDSIAAGGSNAGTATFGELSRSKNASSAATQFKQCSKEIHETCDKMQPMPDDRKNAQAMLQACDDADSAASKVAAETKKSGDTLGDMGKLMDTAGKALGAAAQLAQMMQQQNQQSAATAATPSGASGDGGATSPTPSSVNPETSSTGASGSGTSVQPSAVGFGVPPTGNGVSTSSPGASGSTSAGSSASPYRDPASSSSSPLGSGAAGGAVGSSGGGGSGGGGSAGSSNGTGASRPLDGAAAVDAAGTNYEVNGAGGRAIVGLKPSKGDMDAVSDGATTPPALDAAKLDDLGKAPGDNAAADDELAHDGESIFLRVRQKYSLLKGAGRI